MDYLQKFRLDEKPRRTEKPTSTKIDEIVETNFVTQLVLLSHNRVWKYLQSQWIFIRFVITTFTIMLLNEESGLTYCDIINTILDVLFALDFISAVSHRIFWSGGKKSQLTKKSSGTSRLLWRNDVYKPRMIWMLLIDVFTLIPFELVRIWVDFHSIFHYLGHSVPALRVYRIPVYFVEVSNVASVRVHGIIQLLLKFALIAALITHSMVCVWYLIMFENSRNAIIDLISFDVNTPYEWYLVVCYFIQQTFTNIGFGDIHPRTDNERMLAIFISSVGFVLFNGYLIGGLSSVISEKARRLSSLRFRLGLMKNELANRKVPQNVSKKVLRFYYSLWITRRGAGSVNPMLDKLPTALSTQINFDIFSDALNASLLFRSCDEFCKRALARVMSIHLYMQGDAILKRSEINSRMCYIRKGTIQIMSYQDDETQIMTFGAGTVLGQCALLLSIPAKSQVHAATFCEIHALDRRDLFYVLADYPDGKDTVRSVHKNLILNVLADKYPERDTEKFPDQENLLDIRCFYKEPLEASKLARDDICIITTFPYTFMPDTIFLHVWHVLHGILIVGISFYYPYCAAFVRKYPEPYEAIILLVDVLYYVDIYLTLSTAVNKHNILITAMTAIVKERFTQLYIIIDIVATLPIHYFLGDERRLKPVLLCLRCLKLYKIPLLFAEAEHNVNWSIGVLRLIKYLLYFVFGAYAIGLAFYMQACYEEICRTPSWYDKLPVNYKNDSPVYVSLYFATMVVSATGYGDISVTNLQEITWVLFFFFIGVFLFCYLIAEYSAHLSLGREPRKNFIELAERVNTFLVSNRMLSSERIRVRQYLNLQWEMNQGFQFTDHNDLFYDTPSHLTYEIAQNMRRKGIHGVELFKGLSENTINAILHRSFRKVLPPHEVVIYAGEVCRTLLVIEEGYCEMTLGKDVTVKKIIGPGRNLCAVELILGLTSTYHVRTLTHCIILKVMKSDIRRALALNPIAAKELDITIHEFRKLQIVKTLRLTRPIRLHLQVRPPVQKSVFRFPYYRKQSGNKELREPYSRLGICQGIRFLLRNTTVLPYGKWLKRWELSRCFFAFWAAIIFPPLPYLQLEWPWLNYIGWLLDIVAWIDLYFRLHVCYYNDRKLLVTHPLWTSGHYIKSGFALDFIFCFPFDRIMSRSIYDANNERLASEISNDILRLLRVGQTHRIPATLMNLGHDFLSTPSIFLMILMLTGYTAIFLNLLTNLLVLNMINYKVDKEGHYRIEYTGGRQEDVEEKLKLFGFSSDPSLVLVMSFYWVSVTAFGVGFGDLTATSTKLMIFLIVVILLSYLYFNYVTIVVASHLSSLNMTLTVYQKRLTHLLKFLQAENVHSMLRQHTINHFEHVWKKSQGMQAENVFSNFNLALKDDVMLHLYEETLKGVPAFQLMDPTFFRILSNHLTEHYYQAGAAIFKRGDIISQVHIVHHGEATLVGRMEDQTAVLGRSRIFGHVEDSDRSISKVSAVATKNLHVLCIPASELYHLIEEVNAETVENVKEKKSQTEIMASALWAPTEEEQSGRTGKDDQIEAMGTRYWLAHTSYKHSKNLLILYMIVSFISINSVSYHLAFRNMDTISIGVAVPIEIIFCIKIYLGFNTGFLNEAGDLISDLEEIRKRYMRMTGFYLDLLTVIPFELIAVVASPQNELFYVTCLRMTKILRIYNIWVFFNLKFDKLNVNMLLLKLFAMAIWTATLLHQCTCAWYMVSCPEVNCVNSITWAKAREIGCEMDYLCSLYFVIIVLTATGFGDITPSTLEEILYVIILMFIARFYTAIFIGQVVSTVQKSLYAKTNYEFDTERLKDYLNANNVSPALRRSVLGYVQDLWKYEKGQQLPELLLQAPAYLSSEIKISAYGHHINQNPIFQECQAPFKKQLINVLHRTIYFPGNIIVHEGEVNGTTYFIHSGMVGANQKDGRERLYVTNGFFGMQQGIRRRVPHTNTYYAKSLCVILSLVLEEWEFLIDFYPDDVLLIFKGAKKYFNVSGKNKN